MVLPQGSRNHLAMAGRRLRQLLPAREGNGRIIKRDDLLHLFDIGRSTKNTVHLIFRSMTLFFVPVSIRSFRPCPTRHGRGSCMRYLALVIDPISPRKSAALEPKERRSGAPRTTLAMPWLSHCSYSLSSDGFGSVETWRRLQVQPPAVPSVFTNRNKR